MPNRTKSATVRVVEAKAKKSDRRKLDQRGSIGRLVSKMLLTKPKLTYGDIAEAVKAKAPGASTSARSVASIAHGLRAAGLSVPEHPRPARG